MKRLSENKRLRINDSNMFNEYRVIYGNYQIIHDYLKTGLATVERALNQYPYTYAVHMVLKLPEEQLFYFEDNSVMHRFTDALNSRVKNHNKAHNTIVRYIWCREQSSSINPHFHVIILVNRQSYRGLGEYYPSNGQESLYSRIAKSWYGANGLDINEFPGLVHVDRQFHVIHRAPEALDALSCAVSYLCKAETKQFGHGFHVFGCSKY